MLEVKNCIVPQDIVLAVLGPGPVLSCFGEFVKISVLILESRCGYAVYSRLVFHFSNACGLKLG